MRLIDADALKDFFFSERSEMKETIRNLMAKYDLDYGNDVDEDDVRDFASELLEKVRNVIDTQPTAYDIDKVVEEHFTKIMSFINTSNRGNSDYFIVDQIENYITEQLKEQNK